jgi:hypothetical protein
MKTSFVLLREPGLPLWGAPLETPVAGALEENGSGSLFHVHPFNGLGTVYALGHPTNFWFSAPWTPAGTEH